MHLDKPITRHYNLDIGRGDLLDLHKILLSLAENWDRLEIQQVRTFMAGLTSFYISITAQEWYHISDCNDPDYEGDAHDCITDNKGYQYRHKWLMSPPRPEKRWHGSWKQYTSADALREFAQSRIEKIQSRRQER